jgi:hypothetical protein
MDILKDSNFRQVEGEKHQFEKRQKMIPHKSGF